MRLSIFITLLLSIIVNAYGQVTSNISITENIAKNTLSKDVVIYPKSFGNYTVYNGADGEGFVIVASHTSEPYLLGYSEKGKFSEDNIPIQLKTMLDNLGKKDTLSDNMETSRSRAMKSLRSSGKLLPTAEWGQGSGFNEFSPSYDGIKSPTGCGATALAIIMKYYNFPERGIGQWSYFNEGTEIGFDYDATPFDWDHMPDKITPSTSQEEKEAISQLMYAAGVALGTTYSKDQSSHKSGDEACALSYFFDYSPDCHYVYKENFSDEEFLTMTLDQIDNGNPVIYGGAPLEIPMGHAWIVDGYNQDGTLLHCNWGWEGELNGYYALNQLMGRFFCDGMVINARPSEDNEDSQAPKIRFQHFLYGTVSGLSASVENITSGQPFIVDCNGLVFRVGNSDTKVSYGLALVDANNNVKEILYTVETTLVVNPPQLRTAAFFSTGITTEVIISEDVEESDKLHVIYGAYDTDSVRFWKTVYGSPDAPAYCNMSDHNMIPMTKMVVKKDEDIAISYLKLSKDIETGQTVWAPFEIQNGDTITTTKGRFTSFQYEIKCVKPNYGVSFDFDGHIRGSFIPAGNYNIIVYPEDSVTGKVNFMYGGTDIPVLSIKTIRTIDNLSVVSDKPGNIGSLIPTEKAKALTSLTIFGRINAADIWYIADNMQLLRFLDLSQAKIEECSIEPLPWYESFFGSVSSYQRVNSLPDGAFNEMYYLENLSLPENLESIGNNAICIVPNLKQLTLPASLKSVDVWSLREFGTGPVISLNPVPPVLGDFVFENTGYEYTGILYVPESSLDAYKAAPGWCKFSQILPIEASGIDESIVNPIYDNEDMEIYNLQGIIVYKGVETSLSSLPKGIYIVKHKGVTMKIKI